MINKNSRPNLLIYICIAVSILNTACLTGIIVTSRLTRYGELTLFTSIILLIFTIIVTALAAGEFKSRIKKLEEANRILTVTDDLTSLYNRNFFLEKINAEFERAKRYNYPLSLVIAGIDSFNSTIEKSGIHEGDMLIKNVADIIKPLCRESDTIARFRESEFAILLPNTGPEGAMAISEKLRTKIGMHRDKNGDHPVTVSLGVSTMSPDSAYSAETLIYDADTALFRSQEGGRNRATLYVPV